MKRVFLFLCIFIVPINTVAQWRYMGLGNISGNQTGAIFSLDVYDTSIFVGTNYAVLRYTVASGWVHTETGIDFSQENVTSFASLGPYLFAGMTRTDNGTVGAFYRSSNDGGSWDLIQAAAPAFTNGTYLFGNSLSSAYRSRDEGNTWQAIACPKVSTYASIGVCIFANTGGNIWRSTDSGTNWAQITTPAGLSISAFGILGTHIFAGGMGVFRSTDSGQNWTQISLPNRTVNALATYGTYLFSGTDTGIYISSDSGITWQNVSNNMGARPGYYPVVNFLGIFDTFLIAGVYAGKDAAENSYGYVTERPISEMTDTTKSAVQEVPASPATALSIYPNPLTNTATISYTLAENARVSITIYDALGRTVSIPTDDIEESSGDHTLDFNASRLPSGIYWCHLSAGTLERSAKLVIER
jgi:hypothetical protein